MNNLTSQTIKIQQYITNIAPRINYIYISNCDNIPFWPYDAFDLLSYVDKQIALHQGLRPHKKALYLPGHVLYIF